jgi:hypothetical protein
MNAAETPKCQQAEVMANVRVEDLTGQQEFGVATGKRSDRYRFMDLVA